jgi:hypothetical protein
MVRMIAGRIGCLRTDWKQNENGEQNGTSRGIRNKQFEFNFSNLVPVDCRYVPLLDDPSTG